MPCPYYRNSIWFDGAGLIQARRSTIIDYLHFFISALEVTGAVIILASAGLSLVELGKTVLTSRNFDGVDSVRLRFAQKLVLGLEYLIAADILSTLHSITLESISVLGAIILIRTVLSMSIAYELRHANLSIIRKEKPIEAGFDIKNKDALSNHWKSKNDDHLN